MYQQVQVKSLSRQTTTPQRLNIDQKKGKRAVGLPRNVPKNIELSIYSMHSTSSERLNNSWKIKTVQYSNVRALADPGG